MPEETQEQQEVVQEDESAPQGEDTTDWKAESRKWEARAKKDADKAKANAKAAQELVEFKQQSMSEAEKAIDAARAEGRTSALAEAGGKLAAAEIRAVAAGRMDDEQVAELVGSLDLSKFLTETGNVNAEAVTAFVGRIAPQQTTTFPDLGQGARQTIPLNGDPLLRDLKTKLGIR